jgi:RNA polymerase sigma-70 factor (ECF subfamily)
MTQPSTPSDELEARLATLHEESFGWACACCAWNEMEAEDVLQTAYVKVISGRARFEERSSFRTWLFGVIRLTAMERRRRVRLHREKEEGLAGEPVALGQAPAAPDEVVEDAELAERLRDALAELSERQAEVLELVFYQGLSVREAAEVMEVSIGSARIHYDRGKKRLRALLAESEVGGGAP